MFKRQQAVRVRNILKQSVSLQNMYRPSNMKSKWLFIFQKFAGLIF